MLNMMPTVLRNLVTKKPTRQYPFEVREPIAGYRGELLNKIEDCIFCGSCQRKCPTLCLTVDKTKGTWDYDPFACVFCGICVDGCPTKCLSFKPVHKAPFLERETETLQGTPPQPKKKAKPAEEE